MPSYSPVNCAEVSHTDSLSLSDWTPSAVLSVDFNTRYALMRDLLANFRGWPYADQSPGFVFPRAQSISNVKYFGRSVDPVNPQLIVYNKAHITVQYGLFSPTTSSGDPGDPVYDLVTETMEPDVEFQNLDHKLFKWGSVTGRPLLREESPGRRVLRAKLVRTYFGLAALPAIAFNKIGYCNNSAHVSASLGITFPAESLLLGPPRPTKTIRSDGTDGWTLVLSFMYKEEGWNKFWNPDSSTYERIYDKTGPYDNYPLADLQQILT